MPNQPEYQPQVGLDSLYAALVTKDDATGYTAETPEYFAPAVNASAEPTTGLETFYADNKAFVVLTSEGETKITLDTSNIPIAILAKYLGKKFDVTTGRMYDEGGGAVPPDAALSFRSEKANGKNRYFQYLKGKFSVPKDESATIRDTKEPKPNQIVFTAVNTVYKFDVGSGVMKSIKRVVGDEDSDAFSGTSWFSQVQVPAVATPDALTLSSSVPAHNATGIAVAAATDRTLTFSNALQNTAINGVSLHLASDGSLVALAATYPSLDASKKIITMRSNAALTALTAYLMVYHVTDIYGQVLKGAVKFTTA